MTGIEEIIRGSVVAFNALSPEEQKELRRTQRRSWVIGEMMLSHPAMTRAEAERLYDRVVDEA